MSNDLFFSQDEFEDRVQRVKQRMAERGLEACLISAPENIYYLTGLDHLGYFAYHILILPREGENILIARAMEHVTVETFVKNARFEGYSDSSDQVKFTCEVLQAAGLGSGSIGVEKNTLFLPPLITEGLAARLPDVNLVDVSGMVDGFRRTKSPRELEYTRQAAKVADAMMNAANGATKAGANEKVRRYHAAMGRLIFVEEAPPGTRDMANLCTQAFGNVVETMRPGVPAREVYAAWQAVVDRAGLSHYRRHHCGYMIGVGMPPSWIGGNMVVGLRHDSDMVLKEGMVFHLMSWLMDTGRPGDYFVSDT
ncbi:MAG: Xaa-Pro peptidase family protein, partial [Anaerolineales bacterium]